METITALPGTRDLFAPEIARWQDMEANARRVLTAACFSEIRTPVFERTLLFERGVGERRRTGAKLPRGPGAWPSFR